MKDLRTFKKMLIIRIILIITLISAGVQILPASDRESSPKRSPLRLDYLANEGVMISVGNDKILIDALFNKPHPNYRAPSAETLARIIKGQAPFDQITMILFTHKHADHFSADLTVQAMENHSKCLLIIPGDMVTELQKVSKNWQKIKSRVIPLALEIGDKTRKTFGKITVHAFRSRHSGDRDVPHNLMYLIKMGSWRIFHEGDSDGKLVTYQKFGLGKDHIDLALVHFWFPLDPGGAKILQELLVPDHIALIHLPKRLEGDAPSKIAQVKKYYKDIFLLLPNTKSLKFY